MNFEQVKKIFNKINEDYLERNGKCDRCHQVLPKTQLHYDNVMEKTYCWDCWELGEAQVETRMKEQYDEPLSERDEYFLAH